MLVGGNNCDQHPHGLNETRLKENYPNIHGFIQGGWLQGNGSASFRREIGKPVQGLPHVFGESPES